MSLVFDQLWGAPALQEMQRTFVSSLRLLAQLMRAPVSSDSSKAIEETESIRDKLATSFETLRQQADGVMLEFGRTREHDLAVRSRLLGWQLRLREALRLRIALLKYRLYLPGFELPERLRRGQKAFDSRHAECLEFIADKISVRRRIAPPQKEPNSPASEDTFDFLHPREMLASNRAVQTFIPLVLRLDSLLNTLEREIELAMDN
jgi:multidrug resistance protein MdtO